MTGAEIDTKRSDGLPGRPVSPPVARFLRPLLTELGMHLDCPRRACRRARACAADDVICYRVNHDDLQPIACSFLARTWQMRAELGRAPPLGDDQRRRIAYEAAEIASIPAGDDDALTPYQLWLKYWVPSFDEAAAKAAAARLRSGG